jgi:arylsulfatase A-like enzyme
MNVLLIHCDALHSDVFRHTKWPFLKTPHLDRLAAESTVFHNAFVQYPTCVPSRASFITGMYPQQLGVFNHGYDVPDSIPTLAHRLNEAGYQSVAFGRTHRQHKGFERFPERSGVEAYGHKDLGFHGDSATITGNFQGKIEEHHDWAAAQQFSDWLDQRADTRPLCAMVGFMAPHTPLFPPAEYSGTYQADDMVLPKFDPAELADKPEKQRWCYENRWKVHPPEVQRDMMAKYFDLCTYVDACVGRVIEAVEKKGLLEDTVIVFFSDHGEMLGEHGMIGKWFSLYDNVLRTPLAIRVPVKTGVPQHVPGSIELIDLVPTVLDLLGQAPASDLPGKSLTPLLEDPHAAHRDAIFSMMETARLIRTPDWKLCVHTGRSSFGNYPRELFHDGEGELYDLQNDPGEVHNLYHDPAHAATRWELARRLLEHEIKIQHNLGLGVKNNM